MPNSKKIIFFIPNIERGGIEKNLLILTKYFLNKKLMRPIKIRVWDEEHKEFFEPYEIKVSNEKNRTSVYCSILYSKNVKIFKTTKVFCDN